MRSGLAPECSVLFAQYELESKTEASGRREHEMFTAVSLKEEEVFEARHARRVGVKRSRKTGGLAAVASQKWHSDQGPKLTERKLLVRFKRMMARGSRRLRK